MKTSVFIKTAAVSAVFSLTLAGCGNAATCPRDYEAQLGRQVTNTFTAVREGKNAVVMKSVGSEGLTLNGQHYSQAQVTEQFKTRSGFYCSLFACGGRSASLKAAFDTQELPQTQYDAQNRVALVLSAPNSNNELMLTYRYSDVRCVWELVDITTP